ncbi:MAG: DNA polymerase III subunit delta [Candidatus Omnitrophica bacterium]|nr:DNA polymerase III subunit delta [Candidatus Omnitrophota bacterium]MBU4479068.1 DNA polymerase III subunit delta [Candidatus Omnitrophota bacterium]MCG2704165.1 DNA polymerase III subunit delta [Candidatus Omnitrophota bacterium]
MVTALTYWDITAQISAGNIAAVYLFTGEEVFLKRIVEEELRSQLLPGDSLHFNYNVFYAQETPLPVVLDTVRTHPFLAKRRLVILKNADHFDDYEREILSFLQSPVPNTVFVLETDKKLNDKFVKKLAPLSTNVVFSRLEGKGLEKWAGLYVRSQGKKISPDAVSVLAEKVGNELEVLSSALEKLCLYVGEAKQIQSGDIERIIKKTREDTRFTFLNALAGKQTARALAMAHELSRNGKQVSDIIGLINWQLKRIENVKRLSAEGLSQERIARELKLSPYAVKIVATQAARINNQELMRGFQLLLDNDIAIKQGRISPALALETIIVRLCTSK